MNMYILVFLASELLYMYALSLPTTETGGSLKIEKHQFNNMNAIDVITMYS